MNLRPADVPGFTGSSEKPEHKTGAERREGHAFSRCVGPVASYHGLVKANSKRFREATSASTAEVGSSVEVAHTATAAAEELALARSPHIRACLSRFFHQTFMKHSPSGGSFGAVSVAFFTPPAPGTRGSFGWRISTTYSLHGIHFPVQFDVLGFGYRTTTVTLFAVGFPQLFPSAQEQRLFTLLVKRAQDFRS